MRIDSRTFPAVDAIPSVRKPRSMGQFDTKDETHWLRGIRTEPPFTFTQRVYPLQPTATIAFTLEDTQLITLRIYDNYGRILRTLYEGALMQAGHHILHVYDRELPSEGCYARLHTPYGVFHRELLRTLKD